MIARCCAVCEFAQTSRLSVLVQAGYLCTSVWGKRYQLCTVCSTDTAWLYAGLQAGVHNPNRPRSTAQRALYTSDAAAPNLNSVLENSDLGDIMALVRLQWAQWARKTGVFFTQLWLCFGTRCQSVYDLAAGMQVDLAGRDFAAQRGDTVVVSTGAPSAVDQQRNAVERRDAEERNRHRCPQHAFSMICLLCCQGKLEMNGCPCLLVGSLPMQTRHNILAESSAWYVQHTRGLMHHLLTAR